MKCMYAYRWVYYVMFIIHLSFYLQIKALHQWHNGSSTMKDNFLHILDCVQCMSYLVSRDLLSILCMIHHFCTAILCLMLNLMFRTKHNLWYYATELLKCAEFFYAHGWKGWTSLQISLIVLLCIRFLNPVIQVCVSMICLYDIISIYDQNHKTKCHTWNVHVHSGTKNSTLWPHMTTHYIIYEPI